jgi:DNA mismatch repair protein MutH
MERRTPPPSVSALLARAKALSGLSLGEIAMALQANIEGGALRTKGKFGALLECALGASETTGKQCDFPELGIELKSIPVTHEGAPIESTYVCTLHLASASELTWPSSWVKQKLSKVLWLPVRSDTETWEQRVVMPAVYWQPSDTEQAMLRADFEECVGLVTTGNIEALTAHVGTALQVRPKARDGSKTASVQTPDGDWTATVPKGFYLRSSFTKKILQGQ